MGNYVKRLNKVTETSCISFAVVLCVVIIILSSVNLRNPKHDRTVKVFRKETPSFMTCVSDIRDVPLDYGPVSVR